MTSSLNTKVAAVLLSAAAAAWVVGFAAAAHANEDGMHGDPGAAAPYWRYQQQDRDCGEMAVADVIGEITGHEASEDEIDATAGNVPSGSHSGPIYRPDSRTSNGDLAVLLTHYGIQAASVHTNIDALEQDLDRGRKVIAGVNNKTSGTKAATAPRKTTSWSSPASTPRPVWCTSTTAAPRRAATSRFPSPPSKRRGAPATTSPS